MERRQEKIYGNGTMKKYLSIYKTLSGMNFSELVSFRANLINSLISNLVWGTFSILLIVVLTSKTPEVFGWTRYELFLLFGIYNIYMGLFYVFFSRSFERFSQIIHLGELDFVLVKPIDSQFLMSFRYVNHPAFLRVIVGTIFSAWVLSQMGVAVTAQSLLLMVLLLVCGIAVMYGIWYIFLTCLIWWTNLTNLVGLLYEMNGLTRYPGQMFQGISGLLFYSIFPLTLVITTPAQTLVNKVNYLNIALVAFFAVLFISISRSFWKFALKFYSSASS